MDKFEMVVQRGGGGRLDSFIADNMAGHSRSFIQKLIEQNMVSVNDRPAKSNYKVKKGDRIQAVIPKPQRITVEAAYIPLDVVYEDGSLIVINKPAGMVVHPAPGNRTGTLVNALLHHCDSLSEVNDEVRPGIVHRIDKDTTGLLVAAKNEKVHKHLVRQLKDHSITRKYIALVKGEIDEDGGSIEAPIGRHPTDRKRMAVVAENSRHAATHFKVINRFRGYTLMEARLETGRTHQIRVHMHYIGHPVVGDLKYGRPGNLEVESLMLHAAVLGFIHPEKDKYVEFRAPLPGHFQKVIDSL
ncbi:MAG: RluA family pseudouridine synthase [Firmicutes bacterium]|nr:RluA family pseudouridine synthase [Bacillota bacterium]